MISLDNLRTFKEFVECGSMQGAARKLGLTQPAVSLQLKKLAANCPQPIFVNEGNRKLLSSYGKILFEACCEDINLLLTHLDRALSQQPFASRPTIRIAGREEFLLHRLEAIKHEAPPGALELIPCSSEVAARKIVFHEADIALSYHLPQSSEIVAKSAFVTKPTFAYSKNLGIKTLKRETLLETPLLIYSKNDATFLEICRQLNVSAAKLHIGLVSPSWQAIHLYAIQGRGLAIMPSIFATNKTEVQEVKALFPSLKDGGEYSYSFLYAKNSAKKQAIQQWLKFLRPHI